MRQTVNELDSRRLTAPRPVQPPQAPGKQPLTFRQRLVNILLPYFKPTRSELLPTPPRYFLLRPIPFEFWFRGRAAWLLFRRRWTIWRTVEANSDAVNARHYTRVVEHNFANRWLFNRRRTEKLMNILRSIGGVSRDSRILVIGPRNEAEVLLLSLYGFKLRNIVGADLLTYSPLIQQMDMHDLRFEDSSFDIVYVLYTLSYSYDLPKACAEIIRVVRDGGLVAVGFQWTEQVSDLRARGSELKGGIAELHSYFEPHVQHVFWQEAEAAAGFTGYRATTIFAVKK